MSSPATQAMHIPAGKAVLEGDMTIPETAKGLVLFAHGSGSGRHSPRNRYVAGVLNEYGFATLLADLLTAEEEVIDQRTRHLRFDISMLAERLEAITAWIQNNAATAKLPLGYFGASTGAAAALIAAARQGDKVRAVVSRGGRPDLAGDFLPIVKAPALLIVGGHDPEVMTLNRRALEKLNPRSTLSIIPGATHLFEEPGTLESAAQMAAEWFREHLHV
ncbi:MAG: dienelactone hydrolase family protein [Alphaproteobacteria bacterium]|nr:dienelactone hydrolase family protein [Alphaproteobacteria bacterium]